MSMLNSWLIGLKEAFDAAPYTPEPAPKSLAEAIEREIALCEARFSKDRALEGDAHWFWGLSHAVEFGFTLRSIRRICKEHERRLSRRGKKHTNSQKAPRGEQA